MRTRLPADRHAPRLARNYVRDHLSEAELPRDLHVEDVALIASELVTNAVRAGAAKVDLEVTATGRRVELTVEDDAGGWPVVMTVDEHATNGRGLSMVEQLSDALTVTRLPVGKRVTASWVVTASA
jgi:anti-sigma regulatory factor (Ser/Thr protein kinase)